MPREGLLTRNRSPLFTADADAAHVEIAGSVGSVMPAGEFALVLCVTEAQVTRLLSAASLGADLLYGHDAETVAPLLSALNTIDAPLCLPESDCDDGDDIWEDTILQLADGVLANILSGGQVRAIGYEIEEEGSIETETELPLIAVAFVGLAAAFVVTLILGGVTIGAVAVAAGETVELLIATGASAGNIIPFVALAAAA